MISITRSAGKKRRQRDSARGQRPAKAARREEGAGEELRSESNSAAQDSRSEDNEYHRSGSHASASPTSQDDRITVSSGEDEADDTEVVALVTQLREKLHAKALARNELLGRLFSSSDDGAMDWMVLRLLKSTENRVRSIIDLGMMMRDAAS